MTTPIQAAIEALTKIARWHGEFPDTGRTWDHGTPMSYGAAFGSNGERDYMRQVALDVLAALQAALAQGSIDTAEFSALAARYGNSKAGKDYMALVAHTDAHIVQRAASGDARTEFEAWMQANAPRTNINRLPSGHYEAPRVEDLWKDYLKRRATPAPIADEVAGSIGDVHDFRELAIQYRNQPTRDSYRAMCACIDARLPASAPAACPKCNGSGRRGADPRPEDCVACDGEGVIASAPDAPAGDLPPLPEPWRYYDIEGYSPDHMHAYVLADRAARGAAAPAGHAEPVAEIVNAYGDPDTFAEREIVALTDVHKLPIGTKLYAAPVAAEPAPAETNEHWLATTARGEACGFGNSGLATAWAGKNGSVRHVPHRAMPELVPAIPAQSGSTCWCATCRPITMADMRMVLCPACGNKRCPRAADHRHACTNSNEPGQIGCDHE